MNLSNIFLWLDIDGVVLDWVDLKRYLEEEIFDPLIPGGAEAFWTIYEGLRDESGQVNFGEALNILVQRYQFDAEALTARIKNTDFNDFVYDDFRNFALELKNFGGFGIFSQGTFWYQSEKVADFEKLLPVKPKAVLIAEDKTKVFDRMRTRSLDLYSLYVDDRKIYLEMALEQKAVDLGIWLPRESVTEKPRKKILVVDNFIDLMKELTLISPSAG